MALSCSWHLKAVASEFFEEPRLIFGANTEARVAHAQQELLALLAGAERDRSAIREFERVAEQVGEHTPQEDHIGRQLAGQVLVGARHEGCEVQRATTRSCAARYVFVLRQSIGEGVALGARGEA